MAFSLPTYDTLKTAVKSVYKNLIADASVGEGSDLDINASTLAHIGHGLHLHIKVALDNLIPTRANADWAVQAWCWLFGLSDGGSSYGKIIARGSSGSDALTVTATAATADLQGETFTDEEGNVYQINESYTFGGAGSANLDVAAVSTGLATNLNTSDSPVLEWVSTPANVSATITLVADLTNGVDAETNAEARVRLAELLQSPSQSGNAAQWRQWVEESIPGSLDAWIYGARNGGPFGWGTVDYTATQRGEYGTDRVITTAQGTTMDSAVDDNAPILINRNDRRLTVSTQAKDIDATIELAPGADDSKACDWDAESIKTTVASHDAGGGTIVANGNCTSPTVSGGLIAGDRVLFYESPELGPVEGVVDSVTNGTTFEVGNWPWSTGANALDGLYIMSGGGVILDCIDAINDYAQELGPERGDYAAAPALWDDQMRVKHIQKAALNTDDSILDVVVNDIGGGGAVDLSPTASITTTVYMLIPNEITVWESK